MNNRIKEIEVGYIDGNYSKVQADKWIQYLLTHIKELEDVGKISVYDILTLNRFWQHAEKRIEGLEKGIKEIINSRYINASTYDAKLKKLIKENVK